MCVCLCESLLSLRRSAACILCNCQPGQEVHCIQDFSCRFSDDCIYIGPTILQPSSAAPGRSNLPGSSLMHLRTHKAGLSWPCPSYKTHLPYRYPTSELFPAS
ncbi:hypothetical protein CRENBAI_008250 [Crenichthys baileyi]|uniref:Secreted protein n=1 Tax=Crenichthys baileyi TaxID=28760 RepID=A0AAV9SLL9_9TELE